MSDKEPRVLTAQQQRNAETLLYQDRQTLLTEVQNHFQAIFQERTRQIREEHTANLHPPEVLAAITKMERYADRANQRLQGYYADLLDAGWEPAGRVQRGREWHTTRWVVDLGHLRSKPSEDPVLAANLRVIEVEYRTNLNSASNRIDEAYRAKQRAILLATLGEVPETLTMPTLTDIVGPKKVSAEELRKRLDKA